MRQEPLRRAVRETGCNREGEKEGGIATAPLNQAAAGRFDCTPR